jgi:acetyltransferase-like isoleucine patch superfamily enzyme
LYSNIKIGKNVNIDWNTIINTNNNKLIIGDNVYLRSKSKEYHAGMPFNTTILIDIKGASCEIGRNCRLNGVYLHAQKKIVIGKNTVIASGVNILDSNGHEVYSFDRTKRRDNAEEIIIGDNVWIGLNSIILKGSKIGNNSIVTAGSVVKGEIPENVIVQGNPAKIVKEINYKT